jgi:hypothetical protein
LTQIVQVHGHHDPLHLDQEEHFFLYLVLLLARVVK